MDKITDDILESYLDGLLSEDETASVEKLLSVDAVLRDRLAFIEKVDRAVITALDCQAPPQLSASVMYSVALDGKSLSVTKSDSRPALYAFLGIIVSLIGIAVLAPSNATSSNDTSLSSSWGWLVTQLETFTMQFHSMMKGFGALNLGDKSILPIAGVIAFLMLLDILVLRPLHKKS
jgi:anti-sigma factor RsiW